MYSGFRLKIEDMFFPDMWIARGTYSCVENKRVTEIWTDADWVDHEETTGETKAVIEFSIREHNSDIHCEIMTFFQKLSAVMVTYYSDRMDTYKTGIFRIEAPKFSHKTAGTKSVQYGETKIKMIEN